MTFSSAPYAQWAGDFSSAGLPISTGDVRMLPESDAAGMDGTPPKAADILYLIDRVCRICTASGFRKQDLFVPPSYNPYSRIPDKATLVELANFIVRIARDGRRSTYTVKSGARLWKSTPELTEGMNYLDDVIKAQAVEPLSDPDLVRDTVDDGDSIRALYQDVINLSRFVIQVGRVTTYDEVSEYFTSYGDESLPFGGYPVLGPYVGRDHPIIRHDGETEEAVDIFSDLFGEVASFGWSGGSEYLYRYLTMDSPFYIQISRTGSAHPQSLRGSLGILSNVARYNTPAKLILVWWVNGANATKRFPSCQIAIPYDLVYNGTLGGLHMSSAIDFLSQARALMQLYRQKYPSWYSSRVDFDCGIVNAWFDTGTIDTVYWIPDGWKFERSKK